MATTEEDKKKEYERDKALSIKKMQGLYSAIGKLKDKHPSTQEHGDMLDKDYLEERAMLLNNELGVRLYDISYAMNKSKMWFGMLKNIKKPDQRNYMRITIKVAFELHKLTNGFFDIDVLKPWLKTSLKYCDYIKKAA